MPTSQEPQTLAESLEQYTESVPEAERLDALHELFYGFYSRVAIIDRTTLELARWAQGGPRLLDDLTPTKAEAMRDNALHVGQDLFGARMRAMAAMRLVSARMAQLREPGSNPAFTSAGRWRSTRRRDRSARTTSHSPASIPTCPTTRSATTRPPSERDQVAARPPPGIDEDAVGGRAELQAVAGGQLVLIVPSTKRSVPSRTHSCWWMNT